MKKILNKITEIEIYKKWWFWSILVVIIFLGGTIDSSLSNNFKKVADNSKDVSNQLITTTPISTPEPTLVPTPSPTPDPTIESTPEPTVNGDEPNTNNQSVIPQSTPKPTSSSTPISTPVPTPKVSTPVSTPINTPVPTTTQSKAPAQSSSNTPHVTVENDKIDGVWIGETGNKYHNKNCRTLKRK